eukprot:SAG31_NODE_2303_length_5975_cov_2.694860_3_plen_466_part_01
MLIPGHALPGFEQPEQVVGLLKWSLSLISSQREFETNAGARILKVVFQRYVVRASWTISLLDSVSAAPNSSSKAESTTKFLSDILVLLRIHQDSEVSETAHDCSRVHGLMMALHHCLDAIDFRSFANTEHGISSCAKLLASMIDIAEAVADGVLSTIGNRTAYGAGCLPADSHGRIGFDDMDTVDSQSAEQLQVVGSWHACKEMSAVVATIATKAPFPDHSDANISPLSVGQVSCMGEILMKVLLTTRHNGAIEKSFLAFQLLCKRISRSTHEEIVSLNFRWLEKVLSNVLVEDEYTLRRSAGIPFCILAILYAEGATSQRPLLKHAMTSLIAVAQDASEATNLRVHSLNVLRALFKDTDLSLDVMGYVGAAFMIAIRGVQSKHWAITNSSSLLFAALVARSMGRQSVNDRTARSGVTAVEFFSKFTELYDFVREVLSSATTDLDQGGHMTAQMDPGAFFVLLLLS